MRRYRQRMREAGLRLVQLWVPDTRGRGFRAECRRQSRLAAANRRLEHDILEFVDATRDDAEWTE